MALDVMGSLTTTEFPEFPSFLGVFSPGQPRGTDKDREHKVPGRNKDSQRGASMDGALGFGLMCSS